ncbi:MAG TPA: alpha/beta hydrolase [Oleiagrimonas sp.]|nr:alpha/beta hydrolase [Oleiagrimonas sp.]
MKVVACVVLVVLWLWVPAAQAGTQKPTVIALWDGTPPAGSGQGPDRPEHIVHKTDAHPGVVKYIGKPRMVVLHPDHPNGTAVLVIGGGGYAILAMAQESMPTAQWLLTLGVTPVILYYRLPDDGWAPVAPFQDAQRAMRLLRARADNLGINPHRIGVIGFSAGGNLAGITATRFAHDSYPARDAADRVSSRPDFAGLIYPVSDLAVDHSGTADQLAAQDNAVAAYTIQSHVTGDTPPTFIVHAADDPVVDVDTSLSLFRVLHEHGVAAELHVMEKGGHGFGLGLPGTRASHWPGLFSSWMAHHGWLAPVTTMSANPDGHP